MVGRKGERCRVDPRGSLMAGPAPVTASIKPSFKSPDFNSFSHFDPHRLSSKSEVCELPSQLLRF